MGGEGGGGEEWVEKVVVRALIAPPNKSTRYAAGPRVETARSHCLRNGGASPTSRGIVILLQFQQGRSLSLVHRRRCKRSHELSLSRDQKSNPAS